MKTTATFEDFLVFLQDDKPPLYYITCTGMDKDTVLWTKAQGYMPTFIIFHPDSLDGMKQKIPTRTLVHLRDYVPTIR